MKTIGSSEAAVCLGVQRRHDDGTPYTSELELWLRLAGLTPRYDATTSPAAEAGRYLEPVCLYRYQERAGRAIHPGPKLGTEPWTHPDLPFLHAHPDGLDPSFNGRGAVIEAKCPRALDPDRWGPDGSDEVPLEHWIQVVVQVALGVRLGLCGRRAFLAAMARDPGGRNDPRTFCVYELHVTEEREAAVLRGIRDWYRRHVIEYLPPEPDGSESAERALEAAFTAREEVVRGAEPWEIELHHKLVQVLGAKVEREQTAAELRQRIMRSMGEVTKLVDGRRVLVTWRRDKNGRRRWRLMGR